jgi:hypothetical protein
VGYFPHTKGNFPRKKQGTIDLETEVLDCTRQKKQGDEVKGAMCSNTDWTITMSLPIHVAYSFGAIFALVGICVVNFSIRDLIRASELRPVWIGPLH